MPTEWTPTGSGWSVEFKRTQSHGLAEAPRVTADVIEKNLRTLGSTLAARMRFVLRPVKYKGTLERSVSTEYEAAPPFYQISVEPTAKEREYVRFGTRPHFAPIGPLKEWARWKLGDENAAYAVQRSIAHHGTSVHIEKIGLGDGHGGYNFVEATLSDATAQRAIERTAQRIPLDITAALGG